MILDAQKQLHVSTKNRFLSFTAGDPGRQQRILVTFRDLPIPYDQFNDRSMWVGEPRRVNEIAGRVDPDYDPVAEEWNDWFVGARLQCEKPIPINWSLPPLPDLEPSARSCTARQQFEPLTLNSDGRRMPGPRSGVVMP